MTSVFSVTHLLEMAVAGITVLVVGLAVAAVIGFLRRRSDFEAALPQQ